MNPVQVELAITVIRTLGAAITQRMNHYNELTELFEKASQEGRDFTEEEVELFASRAEAALSELDEIVSEM